VIQRDSEFIRCLVRECNAVTPEGELKWASLCRSSSTYDFSQADAFVSWGESQKLKIRGHNILWPNYGTPTWLRGQLTASNARSTLETHVRTVASRYAGRLYSWDVLNEAMNFWDKRPDGLASYPWAEYLGQEYIDLAFHTAAEADPKARLLWNEHYLESDDSGDQKDRDLLLMHLRRLRKSNVPIHGIGIQSHLFADKPIATTRMQQFLGEVRSLGYEVQLTEIDVIDTSLPGDPAKRDAACADTLRRYLDVVLPLAQPTMISFWTLSDRYNWLDWAAATQTKYRRVDGLKHRPGLLDSNLQPKPAYEAVAAAIARYGRPVRALPAANPRRQTR
jgi:endo-1,4-beta-xylanase